MKIKTTLAKVFAVLLAVAILAGVLSACNFLDGFAKVKNVDISVTNNLNKAESGAYEVGEGGEIALAMDWHNMMIDSPNLRWYVKIGDGERQELSGEKNKTLTYTAGTVGTEYEFSASANSIESNTIKVVVVAGVKDVTIAVTSGLGEKNSSGQYEIEAGSEFSLTANWTETAAGDKSIKWFVSTNGGEKALAPSQTAKVSTWSTVSVGTVYVISVEVNGVESSNAITVLVVEGDTPVVIAFTVKIDDITDTDADGYKEARFGDSFTVSADFGGMLVDDPTFDWFVEEDSVERRLMHTDSSFSFTVESRDILKYEFRAVLKGDDDVPSTNSGKVEFVDFTLEQVALVASPEIVEGKIQQNVFDTMEDVVLTAVWNETELPADVVTFEWRVDNAQQAETSKTFTFDVDSIIAACEKTVKVTIRYKSQTVNTTVVLSFVEEFLPIQKVTLDVTQTSEVSWFGELRSTYKVKNVASADAHGSVTVSALVNPEGTNLAADCTWTVRDWRGTRTLSDKTRSVTIDLEHGKSVITATIENMESRSVIIYALTSDELSDRRSVIEDTFIWNGSVQDHYINNQEELNIFIGYLVSTHETASDESDPNVHNVYLYPSAWRDGVNTSSEFSRTIIVDGRTVLDPTCAQGIAMAQGVDESGSASIAHYGNTKFWLSTASLLGNPSGAYTPATPIFQRNVYVRYSALAYSETRAKVPADDFTDTMLVKNSNQLTRALMWGYKPTFESNATGVKLEQLYNKAKAVLLEYVGKSMTDVQKLQVIYDWLVNEVDYDYAAAAYTDPDGVRYNAYYLEGVFDDHRAVCDGKSKAFALLCGMEGIRAMRIIGTANGGGHAWNKVLVDTDGDGVRDWFFVDCTWGDNKLTINAEAKETLTYQYFLTTDAAMASTHSSDMAQPVCDTAYDSYTDSYVKVSGTKSVCQYVTSLQQLRDLRDYSTLNSGVMIQVELDAATELEIALVTGMGRVSLGDRIYYIYGDTN